jgi:hypothetical protein
MSLSSLIVQREVATMRQVEEALARQVIYGGDFVTNLLEVAKVDEQAVARVLAESVDLPLAPAGELPIPQTSVRSLVPPEMAAQRALVPLVVEDGKLVVAVAEPLPRDVADQLGFALGMGLDQRAAPAVRVRQAIARVYGVPLERRMERLVARLSGTSSGTGSMPPPLGEVPKVLEPPTAPDAPPPRFTSRGFPAVRPSAAPAPSSRPPPSEHADSEPPSQPLGGSLLQRDAGPARAVRRRRGPLTLDAAKAEVEEAADRDALLDLFFDFSRQFFDYAAVFIVHADIAEGRDAFGTGASREKVQGIGVPLDLPGLLSTARDKRGSVVARPPGDGLDAQLLGDLQRPRDAEMAVIPLVVRTRAVALLVGDCGDAGIDRASLNQIVGFTGVVGKAFERIIVRRKLDGFIAGSRGSVVGRIDPSQVAHKRPTAPPPPAVQTPVVPAPTPVPAVVAIPAPIAPGISLGQPVSAAVAVSGTVSAAPILAPPPPIHTPPGPTLSRPPQPPPPDEDEAAAASSPKPAPVMPVSAPPPPVANLASMKMIAGPPIPREEPESPGRVRAARPISVPPPRAAAAATSARGGSAPEVELIKTETEEDAALFDELGWELDEEAEAKGPPSAAIAVPPHAPPSRHSVRAALPSIIVDIEQEVRELMVRVTQTEHDDNAEGELLRLGDRAMPIIMTIFPGPVSVERARIATAPVATKASDSGPVLRLVARQRKVALPFVLEKLESDDPETRGWATHLLVELPYVEALPYALLALRDPDPATRTSAALAVAAISRTFPDEVVTGLNEMLRAADPQERAAAVRAMAELREAALVPELIRALGDGDEAVVAASERALAILTRQDMGGDARRWVKWWELNANRHRIEWLIDALTHEVSEIRRAAGDELKAVTKEYFGFAPELPARDRERAQQRYRDWWITEGKARFRRKS